MNFTSTQKLKVAKTLIGAGVDYVEGGWPNETNPTDLEFFKLAKGLDDGAFSHVTAFGMTRRPRTKARLDPSLSQLLHAGTKTVTIFGKAWTFQVENVLKTTLDENLRMISESVEYLRSQGRHVIFDAEHFFDGFKEDPDYASSVLRAAEGAGASVLVLCDTRGGSYPSEVYDATSSVLSKSKVPIGIHSHNDRGMATANSLFAIMAGASHVQGTLNGLGERVGNADLIEVAANLHVMGVKTKLEVSRLSSLSRFAYEMSGLREDPFKPFVGVHAFSHKGGVHGDAVLKTEKAYEFFDPSAFGNVRSITVSSQAGRSSLLAAAQRLGYTLSRNDNTLSKLLREVKRLESLGCNLENADATLAVLFRRMLTRKRERFEVVAWNLNIRNNGRKPSADCKLTVKVDGRELETSASGNGPVHALDNALRLVLKKTFGSAFSSKLTGYRVREIDSEAGTGARVAVYIDFGNNHKSWTTVASSTNIIQASVSALVDGYTYGLTEDVSKNSRISTKGTAKTR